MTNLVNAIAPVTDKKKKQEAAWRKASCQYDQYECP